VNPKSQSAQSKASPKSDSESPRVDWASFAPAPLIGVDEVGRGCLAGPVMAGACVLPSDYVERFASLGVTDSKLLSASRREELAQVLSAECVFALGSASAEEIDQINILQATFLAMRRALKDLDAKLGISASQGHVLVDGHQLIPGVLRQQSCFVKGDLRVLPIAAASILAKVARDRLMAEANARYPGYGFEKHKGYASAEHRRVIQELGPCALHRKTFGGVREYCSGKESPRSASQEVAPAAW
jgi:ribonuclease HII